LFSTDHSNPEDSHVIDNLSSPDKRCNNDKGGGSSPDRTLNKSVGCEEQTTTNEGSTLNGSEEAETETRSDAADLASASDLDAISKGTKRNDGDMASTATPPSCEPGSSRAGRPDQLNMKP